LGQPPLVGDPTGPRAHRHFFELSRVPLEYESENEVSECVLKRKLSLLLASRRMRADDVVRRGIAFVNCLALMMPNTVTMHTNFTTLMPCPKKTREIRTEKSWRAVMIHVKDSGPRTLMAE